ncbi:MAG TPA: sigma-70 family RNA polymerase sigma factor [Candidatus Eisenbacteria bacterium]|nr:sigma-70 family RNA polymerase sigma factor [Candidatus Eisenbacteria bacterium]
MSGVAVADLVARARDPHAPAHLQHAAFAALVERFEAMAFATALRASDEVESARDACQEAFLAAWRLLPALRDPEAFGGWLKRLVRTQCSRARRRRAASSDPSDATSPGVRDTAELVGEREAQAYVREAVEHLPEGERDAIVRFYFLGESLRGIARALGITVGTAGKRVYDGRLRLRRALPRGVAASFLAAAPTPAFTERVAAGVFDEFVGEYRFPSRPQYPVIVRRERHVLVSEAGGQRNVLASRRLDRLAPIEFDGEGRFQRDAQGRISGFVYYEFGRRLGVARKV